MDYIGCRESGYGRERAKLAGRATIGEDSQSRLNSWKGKLNFAEVSSPNDIVMSATYTMYIRSGSAFFRGLTRYPRNHAVPRTRARLWYRQWIGIGGSSISLRIALETTPGVEDYGFVASETHTHVEGEVRGDSDEAAHENELRRAAAA